MAYLRDQAGNIITDQAGNPLTDQAGAGTVCWGHSTGVVEDETKTFLNNWTGSGTIVGSGDAEEMDLYGDEAMVSETWEIGPGRVRLVINKYGVGEGTPVVYYKTGASRALCEADSWKPYSTPFITTGWIKIKVSDDLYDWATTVPPTTVAPSTVAPTTVAPTTLGPTTVAPTTL